MKLVSKMRQSSRIKKILSYSVLAFALIYVFCVPSFGERTSALRYSVYASMILLGISSVLYCFLYDSLKINKACLFVLFFAPHALIGTLIYSHEFRPWFSLVLLIMSFFVFVYAFKAIKNKNIIILMISMAFFAFSLYFIIHYRNDILNFSSFDSQQFRLGTYFDNQNGVAAYASIGFAAPLYLILFEKRKTKFFLVIPILTSLLVGFTTGSRTFLLMVIVFLIVFLYFKFKKHKLIYLIIIASVFVSLVILINLPFLSTLRERAIRGIGTIFGFGDKADTSTIERMVWSDYGFYLGFKNMVFGYGANGFALYSGIGTYSHSNYAEITCNFGLIGLVLFYLPLFVFTSKAIFSKKTDKQFVISFFIYYMIASFSTIIYYKKMYFLVLALIFYFVYIDGLEFRKIPLINDVKKVIFTCDSMGSGGAEKVISTLANEMVNTGIDVEIIGVSDFRQAESFYVLDNRITYKSVSDDTGKKIKPLKRIIMLRKILIFEKPDVVISFLPRVSIYTWLSLIATKIPHIVSERNNPYLDPKGKITRFFKRISFEFANGHVFQTKDALDFYKSSKVKNNSIIIKNPISLSADPVYINDKEKVILAVGRLIKQKNYKCLLDAFKIFNEEKGLSYILKIYGGGPLEEELMKYCEKIGIHNFVFFAGKSNEWHRLERNAAMYVLSSDYEGMPNALAEAMALGIPAISTDCPIGGSRELIVDNFNGMLSPVNNPQALAEKMIELSKQSPKKYFDNTRKMIEEYSPRSITNEWIKYIKNLTKEIYE